jgi:hypothetical protein
MRKHVIAFLILILAFRSAAAAELPQGSILLLEHCPGDTLPSDAAHKNESFILALLTPLLTGIISHGLKAAGASLSEAAQEAQVDSLSTGDHFYTTDNVEKATLKLKSRCVIFVTKGSRLTKRSLKDLSANYRAAKLGLDDNGRLVVAAWEATKGPDDLNTLLKNAGYGKDGNPGVIVVFDVDLSAARSEARLIPRYVVMDHSIREKADDTKARDMTFEVTFTAPGLASPFGKEIFKFDGLKINAPRQRTALDLAAGAANSATNLAMVGQWFGIPAMPEAAKNKVTAYNEALTQINTENTTKELARVAAKALGAKDIPDNCLGETETLNALTKANARLEVEKAKPEKDRDAKLVASLTQETTFYNSCQRLHAAQSKRDDNVLKATAEFTPFDITVNVKEFRDRPAAKFFGEVLSDADVQKGATSAILNAVDPGTREEAAKKTADEKMALQVSFETAIFQAETARVAYEGADDKEKAAKYVDMEYKKRAANRLADELKVPRPYPDAGVWFTG